jgi:hypothetical protein
MGIHFHGVVTIDNYEFYGEFNLAKAEAYFQKLVDIEKAYIEKANRHVGASPPPVPASSPAQITAPTTPPNVAPTSTDPTPAPNPVQVVVSNTPPSIAPTTGNPKPAPGPANASNVDEDGSKKIIVRQLGGAVLLARFTAVAYSVWYGPDGKELIPWFEWRNTKISEKLKQLFMEPRSFDNVWQVSYRLMKCEDQYRVLHGGNEGFTPPLSSDLPPVNGDIEFLSAPGTPDLHVVNDRSPGAASPSSMGRIPTTDWIVLKFIGPAHDSKPSPFPDNHEKIVGICSASDLRKWGAPISRALSWERTVSDVIDGIRKRTLLKNRLPKLPPSPSR